MLSLAELESDYDAYKSVPSRKNAEERIAHPPAGECRSQREHEQRLDLAGIRQRENQDP